MKEHILSWLYPAVIVCNILGSIGVGLAQMYFGSNHAARFGSRGIVKDDDCREVVYMLLPYIKKHIHLDRLATRGETDGCTGTILLYDSKDISCLIKKIHQTGGRLVLRRKACYDIECQENTILEVKKQLSDLDIRRAKRVRRK